MTERAIPLLKTLAILLLIGASRAAHATVTLPALFADHAVLQRDRPLPVWGWASPGEAVTVSLGAAKAAATTGPDGRWSATLAAQPVSRTPLTLTVAGQNTLTVHDVLLGDVWLCSGQSNMGIPLDYCGAPEDVKAANYPLIRQFGVDENFAVTPQKDVRGNWQVCTPDSCRGFSAVAFYFGRKIFTETGVPIGLLRSCVGGTNIELWISQETFFSTPALASYARVMQNSLDQYQRDLAASLPAVEKWTAQSRAALQAGQPIGLPPAIPEFPFTDRVARPRCVTLHNGMIAPLIPFSLKGVIWYQGENNADGSLYVEKVKAMLGAWRRWFGDPNLPFYFVQLASWQKPDDNPAGGDGWAPIREAQRRCLAIPHTGMASAVDIGDVENIHPFDKADVGDRLALWALHNDYGRANLVDSGPLYRSMKVDGGKIRLEFDSVGTGLMVGHKDGRHPTVEDPGAALKRFAVAGADRKWAWADAVIDGNSVVVSSSNVPQPVAVRYAYTMNPAGANLYNREGLPASPFRTDNW